MAAEEPGGLDSFLFGRVRLAQVVPLDKPVVGKTTNGVEGELGLGTTESDSYETAVAVRTSWSMTRPPRTKSPTSSPLLLDLWDGATLYLVEVPTNGRSITDSSCAKLCVHAAGPVVVPTTAFWKLCI